MGIGEVRRKREKEEKQEGGVVVIQETPDHTTCKFRLMEELWLLCFFCPGAFSHD